jgi:integrase-like protein
VAAGSLGYKGGKRVRRKVTGRTKTKIRTKLRDLRRDLDHGVRSSATYTVGDALDDWLANGLSGRSDRTRELYRDTVKALCVCIWAARPQTGCWPGVPWQDHDLVFASAVGTSLDRHNVLREFRKITQAAGLGTVWVPREMRHTFVSVLSSNGTTLEDIADLVGHRAQPRPRRSTGKS